MPFVDTEITNEQIASVDTEEGRDFLSTPFFTTDFLTPNKMK